MEGIFDCDSEILVGVSNLDDTCSNHSFVASPAHGYKSSGEEESGSDDLFSEIFLDSAFFHMPSDYLKFGISLVEEFNLMETIVVPVVTLGDVPVVEVVVDVVVMTKVVGLVNESSHLFILINYGHISCNSDL
jgi:hypothetical protein